MKLKDESEKKNEATDKNIDRTHNDTPLVTNDNL